MLPLLVILCKHTGMDCIGPFHRSAQVYHFILVLVDYPKWYPKAVPLHTISSMSVAQALFRVIFRVAIPKEMLTDQGTLFTSCALKELYELMGIKSDQTSVRHSQTEWFLESPWSSQKVFFHGPNQTPPTPKFCLSHCPSCIPLGLPCTSNSNSKIL